MRAHPAGPRHADQLVEPLATGAPDDVNFVDPAIWPAGLVRDSSGQLVLHGRSLSELVGTFGTPLMLLDETDFKRRAVRYRRVFGEHVFYAGKAFLTTQVARWVDECGLGLDVATGGELAVAVRAGFPAERMLMHGNNKSVEELRAAVGAGVGRIVIDSFDEIDRLSRVCVELGRRPRVLVRVTVGVEAHTHEYIATAHEDQKFGFSLAGGAAAAAVAAVLEHPSLELIGLHSHIGSQIFDTGGFEVAAHRALALMAQVRGAHGVELLELNLGGGLGIAYVAGDDPADVESIGVRLHEVVERECASLGLDVPAVAVEPGRAIVGPTGVTVYEVGTVKAVELDGGVTRRYVSVDGGMSDNIRTALYDAEYTTLLASRLSDAPAVLCRVVGKHCESGDVVVRQAWLPADIAPGDHLVVAATGAYCRSMASTYNYVGRPPVVAVSDDAPSPRLMLRRETVDDLLALDVGVEPVVGG
ncbi:MAG: diaminopimelate decarboxylase [Actinomycetes bacterium]